MLYFSKLKLVAIYTIIIFLSFFSVLNFLETDENFFVKKKVNLGLDLQGGTYLLLEVDSKPMIEQKLQNKLLQLRKELKEKKIKYENLNIKKNIISFIFLDNQIETFEEFFLDKENTFNNYFPNYRSFELDYEIRDKTVLIKYSKFGIIEIKNSTLEDSLEIVRRRIDEVGTNEPTIIKRGNDRILIELPGLRDPSRIKK